MEEPQWTGTPSAGQHYREIASKLREIASECRFPGARREILDLASLLERRADDLDGGRAGPLARGGRPIRCHPSSVVAQASTFTTLTHPPRAAFWAGSASRRDCLAREPEQCGCPIASGAALATGFVEVVRNIPLLVVLYVLFYALPAKGVPATRQLNAPSTKCCTRFGSRLKRTNAAR